MSIKNKVSSQLPEITTYDAGGNITGVVVGSVVANSIASTGDLVGNGLAINGNAVITGNAQIQGTLTFNNTTDITTSNLVIQLGFDQSGVATDGGGMTVGSTDEAAFLYDQPTQTWNSNLGINAVGNIGATGNVAGAYMVGDGRYLTNLPNANLQNGPGISIIRGIGFPYTKAAYLDITATSSIANIAPAGYASCNMIFFGFANIDTPTIDSAHLSAIQTAVGNSAPGTQFMLSVGGAYYDGTTINTTTAADIIANVDAQITSYNASLTGGQITGVDLDLENGITEETITQMVNSFKGLGYDVAIAPQIVATSGTDITITNPTNLGLSSGGATNQYAQAIATGNVDHIFVQTYNSAGFTVGNVAESSVDFFLAAAGALNNCVDSGLQVDIPLGTDIIIGEPSNAGAAYNENNIFGVTANVAYTQSTTLNSLNSAIRTMVTTPALYANITGVGQWSLNNDYSPAEYGDNFAVPGAFTSTVFGPNAPITQAASSATYINNTGDLQLITDNGGVTTGNISASYFIGNGALLTGITSGGNATAINNGTSNVRIATANGNISMSVANVSNVVTVSTNTLRVNGNIFDINGQVYGVAASFAKYRRTTTQTGIVDGSTVVCNVLEDTFGTDIAVNTTNGSITLQPGKTYRLRGSPGNAARTSGAAGTPSVIRYQWFNVTSAALMGTDAYITSPNSDNPTAFYAGTAEVVFTPSVTTVVQFRITDAFQANAIGNGGGVFPWIDIQVIGGGAPIINAAQFGSITDPAFFVRKSTTSTALVDVTNSTFTLPAGTWLVSYSLSSFNTISSSGTTLVIADVANNIVPDSRTTVNATSAEIPMAKSVIITVSTPTQYKLRFATTSGGTSNLENEANKAELIWTQIAGLAPYAGVPNWISAGTIQSVGIGATTTAPTVPTGAAKNNISYKQLGAKTWEVTGVFEVTTGATGAASGSGDYLFTLPAGLQFDTTLPFQAPYQLNVATNSNLLIPRTIPGSTGFSTDFSVFTNTFPSGPVIWDATRYRILFTTGSVFQCWGSGGAGWFAMSNNARVAYWTFTFQST